MTVKTGHAWAGTFVTLDATGALAASADAAGVLYIDGTADAAAVTITGSNPYKWAVTLPTLTAGQRVDMYITGTIGTIATAGIVASEQADTSLTSEVKTETAAILADTGTDGVVLKAAGLNADAVAEIQSGLALEATLTAIKGAGWTNETLVALMTAIESVSAGSGATAQEVWEYVTRTLTDPNSYKADVSALATTAHLQDVEDKVDTIDNVVDAINTKTSNLPASPAPANEYDARMTAIQADLDNTAQYKADVSGIPAAVWSYATRTLSSFGTLVADIWAHATRTLSAFGFTVATNSDANVTAIKNKTDNLPASPAPASEYDAELAAIQADLNNPAQYKADVSGLATTAHVQEVENKIDAIDVTVNTIPTNPLLDTAYTAPDNAGIAAIQSKTDQLTFTTPNKVDATATVDTTGIATSAALAVVDSNVDAIKAKTDALDVSSVTVVTAVNGSTITILRGDTFSGSITDIGALTDYVSLDFTVKESYSKTDDEATIRIRKNASGVGDGLMRLNGAAPTFSALGSIAIDDLASGDITITLDETATDDLSTGTYVYDIQLITASSVKTLTSGKLVVTADVTRLVA